MKLRHELTDEYGDSENPIFTTKFERMKRPEVPKPKPHTVRHHDNLSRIDIIMSSETDYIIKQRRLDAAHNIAIAIMQLETPETS